MLRVVLPAVAARAAPRRLGRDTVAAIYVSAVAAVYVRIAVEIVIVVNGYVIVAAPARAPSPTASPSRSHGDSDSEGNGHARGVISGRRIINRRIRVDRRAVHDGRVVRWDVNHFGIGLLNNDDLLRFHDFGFNFLLFRRFQVAGILGLFPHALDGIHHVRLLSQKGISQVSGPLDIIRQTFDHIGESGHGLDTCVPRLFLHSIDERLVFQIFVFLQPLLKLNKLQRVRRSGEHLGQHRVRV